MTHDRLTAVLAGRVMGWTVGPDRFMMDGRRWLPRWRFQPVTRVADAYRLLEQAAPREYTIRAAENSGFRAKVCIDGVNGEACETSQATAITFAVARALGIDPGETR